MHGWPGAFTEFLDVIPRLTDTFDVVVPSLPGYGFSGPTHDTGLGRARIARAFIELMRAPRLRRVTARRAATGVRRSRRVSARSIPNTAPRSTSTCRSRNGPTKRSTLTDDDKADLAAMAHFQREESGYALEQSTKPQTVGVALNDSPAALLAWTMEKFRAWSDCDGHPENAFTRDQLLTIVTMYWLTETSASAARLYWEHKNSARRRAVRRRADRRRPLSQRGAALPAARGSSGATT